MQVGSRPSERVSILAGDLNLRDAELVASGGLPDRTVDVWERCGARKEVQYTWDMMRNTNLQVEIFYEPQPLLLLSGQLWQVPPTVPVRPHLSSRLSTDHRRCLSLWSDRAAEDHRHSGFSLRPLGLEMCAQLGAGVHCWREHEPCEEEEGGAGFRLICSKR